MAITLKADIPQDVPFSPVSPVTMPSDWTYSIPDSMAESTPPADIAEYEFDARPGQVGSLDVTVAVPAGRPGVTVLPYIETDAQRWNLTEVTATPAGAAIASDFPEFPTGTTAARLGFELREPAAGAILGTNLYTDPRCTTSTAWEARNSWTLSAVTGQTGLPASATTAVQAQCASAGAATNAGLNWYGSVLAGSPPTTGFAVTAGATYTLSCYVFTTKAATVNFELRAYSGTTWTAAATTGTVAASASTWTRVSQTLTVPAGATHLAGTLRIPASVTWAVGDQFRVSCLLVETGGTLNTYYDGETADTASEGFYWNGTADASTSSKYNLTGGATQPGRSLLINGLTMAVQAEAQEVVGAALTRPLRRSVYDALNEAAPQIAVGTPGLLAGSITYLCDTLEEALAIDGVYQFAGLITLETGTGAALHGFQHMAVDQVRLTAERTVPGKPAKWLVQAEVRELVE